MRRGAQGGGSAFCGPGASAKELIPAGMGMRARSCRVLLQQRH